MDKKIITAIVIAFVIAAVLFIALLSFSNNRPNPPKPENKTYNITNPAQRDEHGCLISDGYSWCDAKKKCLKAWEEVCEPERFGRKLGEAINLKWGFNNIIYSNTREIGVEGWLRGSLTVPEGADYQSLCAIFMRGNLTRQLDDGTTLTHHEPVMINGKQVCEIAMTSGPVAPCGTFLLHMDLGSMKAGYNKTQDNWKDFFTCAPSMDSAYCRAECGSMMDVLMYQKRTPMIDS